MIRSKHHSLGIWAPNRDSVKCKIEREPFWHCRAPSHKSTCRCCGLRCLSNLQTQIFHLEPKRYFRTLRAGPLHPLHARYGRTTWAARWLHRCQLEPAARHYWTQQTRPSSYLRDIERPSAGRLALLSRRSALSRIAEQAMPCPGKTRGSLVQHRRIGTRFQDQVLFIRI